MLVLNANIRAFAESPKSHNSYFTALTCVCISFLPKQQKCHTRLTKLFIFLYMCTFYQQFLTFSLLMNRDGLKENYELSYLSFSFYDIIFRVARKQLENNNAPQLFIFYRTPLLFYVQSKLCPKEPEMPLSAVNTPWGPRYRGTDIEPAHRSILKRKFRQHYLIWIFH